MDNKKSKKKLFAIIGGSVLAFVLTVVVSVAVTLAYFGDQAANTSTITMDKAVLISDTDSATDGKQISMEGTTTTAVLPGQKTTAKGTVTLDANSLAAFIAIKPTITDNTGATTNKAAIAAAPTGWVKVGDYYFYANGTDKTATMTQVAAGRNAVFEFTFIVDTALTNDAAEKTITVKLDVIAVQGFAFNATGDKIDVPTIENCAAMFQQFDSNITVA